MDCSPPGSSIHGILGKNTGVGCHFPFQGIFPTQGSDLHLLHRQADSLLPGHLGSPYEAWCAASMRSQRIRHDWATGQQQRCVGLASASLCVLPSLSTLSHCVQTHCPVFISYPMPFLPQWSASLGLVRLSSPSRFTLTHPSSTIGLSLHHTSLGKPSSPTRCSQSLGCSLQKHTSFL